MSSKPTLRLDWCSHEAAKYAVEHWHYSRTMPKSKLAKLGVWEDGQFVGAVVFGVGATSSLVQQYGLRPQQGCELLRVALTSHRSPVSRIIAIAMRLLKAAMPGLRLVVSFADPEQGHVGGIYQAGGWVFSGMSTSAAEYLIAGRRMHGRAVHAVYGSKKPFKDCKVMGSSKYRYLYPLDADMRKQIAPLAKPYPKKTSPRAESLDSEAAPFHGAEGGATPTSALQVERTSR